jgi:hypothetical protein
MSTVPYIFAADTGNIPLSQLDANFANVKAFANTAGYVTGSNQANITSVGTLISVSVSGNIKGGNIATNGAISATGTITGGNIVNSGNITAGNILTGGLISATGTITGSSHLGSVVSVSGNITGGNILNNGISSVNGNITGGNILTGGQISATGNINGGNIAVTGASTAASYSATGNITGGNILNNGLSSVNGNITGGNIITTGVSSRYIDVSVPVYANITATNTYSLSITNSINILIANNTGYTATLNMPTGPRDGQICNFAIYGNTVILAVGTGTVLPTFAGSTVVGTGYRYVYRVSNTSWYRIG